MPVRRRCSSMTSSSTLCIRSCRNCRKSKGLWSSPTKKPRQPANLSSLANTKNCLELLLRTSTSPISMRTSKRPPFTRPKPRGCRRASRIATANWLLHTVIVERDVRFVQQGRFHRDDVYMPLCPCSMFTHGASRGPRRLRALQVYPGRYDPGAAHQADQNGGRDVHPWRADAPRSGGLSITKARFWKRWSPRSGTRLRRSSF